MTDPRPSTADERDTDLEFRARLSWLMLGRLVVATLLLGATLAVAVNHQQGAQGYTARFLLSMIVATYAASLLFAIWLPRVKRLARYGALQIGWDVGLTTALVYASGGASSGFSFLYGVSVLMAALVIGPRTAQLATAVSLFSYSGLSLSLVSGLLPPPADQPPDRYLMTGTDATFTILVNTLGLLLVAVLATALAQRLRRTGGQLRVAAAQAEELSRLNESIIRSLSSGLATTDLAGRVRTINPAGLSILRASPREVVDRPLNQFLDAADVTQPGTMRVECEARRGNGDTFPIGFTKSDLLDREGQRTGNLFVFQDLSEITELRETAERAERLAALGRVAAALAHEIRNPLGAISGSVELVADAPGLDPEDQRLLSIVVKEVGRLDALVNTMLDISRPTKPQRAAHDMGQIAREVVQMAKQDQMLPAGVGIRIEGASEIHTAWVDGGQVRQLLWNLLKNALQHSPSPGEVVVSIRPHEGQVQLEVADEGPGIPPELRARLFDMFYSKRQHGIGLGLALCKQIVDAHGGDIEVRSRAPQGTRFVVTLPTEASRSSQA